MLYCKQCPRNDYNSLVQYLKQNIDFEANIQLLNCDPSIIKSPNQKKDYYINNPFFSRENISFREKKGLVRIAISTNDALFIVGCFFEDVNTMGMMLIDERIPCIINFLKYKRYLKQGNNIRKILDNFC
ncbi:MAG: hypothetical protein LBL62_00310 [Planctomycetaceae bacterium]|jgi:hypothetical protein|nr:hypothetical protein [Planctomycetaceae bacterium]